MQIKEKDERLKKIDLLKEKGINPYADKYDPSHKTNEIKDLPLDTKVSVAGRIVFFRNMGRLCFASIKDVKGKIQIVFQKDKLEDYKFIVKVLNVGDFIGVKGNTFVTHKGELSILVEDFTFLSKALRPLPEKWHGIKDTELKYRKRYLDLLSNDESMERFKFRSDFIWELRNFYRSEGFEEIDTPVLVNTASGALAKPFSTHYNSLDIDVFLRIAPELSLKKAIIGGYEKVFEIARCFRNEGMDPSHLQDFTMVEHYSAYWDYKKNMEFTEKMLTTIIKKLKGTLKIEILNREGTLTEVNFEPPWETVTFRNLLIKDCGIDIELFPELESLKKEINKKEIIIDDIDNLGRGNLIDALYKKVSRNKLINPTFLVAHPIDLSPLARKNDENPFIADRFQLVINGWEVLNAYSELVDPIEQNKRFAEQAISKEKGDEEAMMTDNEYVEAMEYGMPPISGWGMGIERIVALLTKQSNLRDVVLFPLLKPDAEEKKFC